MGGVSFLSESGGVFVRIRTRFLKPFARALLATELRRLSAGIQALKADATEVLHHLNLIPQTIPPTPAGSLPPQNIDFEDPIANDNVSPTAMRLKRNLGKLQLFTMGYKSEDGPRIHPLRPKIIKLFSLAPKDMSESFSNQLQTTSEEQDDSMDCVNRQTSLSDWSMSL